jgi:hypothetical protein
VEVAGGASTLQDSTLFIGSHSGQVASIHGLKAPRLFATLDSEAFVKVSGLAGILALLGESGNGFLYDTATLLMTRSLEVEGTVADLAAFNTTSSIVAAATNGVITVIDGRVGKSRSQFTSAVGALTSVSVNHEDRLVAVAGAGFVEAFDLRNTKFPLFRPGDCILASFSLSSPSSQENINRSPHRESSKQSSRPPLHEVYAERHPTASGLPKLPDQHVIEATTQTAWPHKEIQQSLGISDKMDDQHLDVVARLATLEIEMSEMRKDLKRILALVQSRE